MGFAGIYPMKKHLTETFVAWYLPVSAKQELSLDNGLIISWDTEQLLEQNIMVLPIWKFLLSGDNTDFDY
jgi:predicted AAA+ superfamily ATPase